MGLQATGEINVDVNRQAAFDFVGNPERLAKCIPGCQDLQEISPGRYSAVLSSKVSFISLKFKVIAEVVRMEPPNAVEVKLTGDAIGILGHLAATAGIELSEAGEHRTSIKYSADVALTGKLGGLGQPVFRAKSAELARQFAVNVKTAIEAEAGVPHA
jgi:uncharacterized protein